MKRLITLSVIAAMAFAYTSCKKENTVQPVKTQTEKTTINQSMAVDTAGGQGDPNPPKH